MAQTFDAEHISFWPQDVKTKTSLWVVVPRSDTSTCVGVVKWFARWRRYAFFPQPETVFEKDCLRALALFCEDRTREHKAQNKRFNTATPR